MKDHSRSKHRQKRPEIIIDNYTVESDLFFAPDERMIDSEHIHIFKYFDDDPIISRQRAFGRLLKEADRL